MAMKTYSKALDIRREVDVFVAGGGPAGFAAAVFAARQGASVMLVESQQCLGGMSTAGMIPAFMQFTDGENFLAGGVGKEVLDAAQAMSAAHGNPSVGTSIQAEYLKRVYDDMLAAAGVDFVFATNVIDVLMDGHTIDCVVLAAKSGVYGVKAKVYVDGTGDGDLCAWAGAPFEKGDENGEMMAGTLCSLYSDIDWERVKKPDDRRIAEAIADGVFKVNDKHLPGFWKITHNIGGGNIGHCYGVDNTDERSVTKAVLYGRKYYDWYEAYYKKYLDGYEKMQLVTTGSLLGIRETRRITGIGRLELRHFHERAVFVDEIGRYSYPVDIHASAATDDAHKKFLSEFKALRYGKGESYGIPYGALVPQNVNNVLVAGRCISTDRSLQASIRVIPGCYITGQAAGAAAAMAAKGGKAPADIDVKQLQQNLKAMGGYLPNC